MPARAMAMAPLLGDPRVPPEGQLGQLRGQLRLGPLASPASPSLASLALGAFLAAQVVCGSVVKGGGQYNGEPVQASACGARRALGETSLTQPEIINHIL